MAELGIARQSHAQLQKNSISYKQRHFDFSKIYEVSQLTECLAPPEIFVLILGISSSLFFKSTNFLPTCPVFLFLCSVEWAAV